MCICACDRICGLPNHLYTSAHTLFFVELGPPFPCLPSGNAQHATLLDSIFVLSTTLFIVCSHKMNSSSSSSNPAKDEAALFKYSFVLCFPCALPLSFFLVVNRRASTCFVSYRRRALPSSSFSVVCALFASRLPFTLPSPTPYHLCLPAFFTDISSHSTEQKDGGQANSRDLYRCLPLSFFLLADVSA